MRLLIVYSTACNEITVALYVIKDLQFYESNGEDTDADLWIGAMLHQNCCKLIKVCGCVGDQHASLDHTFMLTLPER